jgi:hypothetical protein
MGLRGHRRDTGHRGPGVRRAVSRALMRDFARPRGPVKRSLLSRMFGVEGQRRYPRPTSVRAI